MRLLEAHKRGFLRTAGIKRKHEALEEDSSSDEFKETSESLDQPPTQTRRLPGQRTFKRKRTL
jgi:hypothetical protein